MPLERAAADGCDVQLAEVTPQGIVTADTVLSLVNEDTSLVSLMSANNETGVVNEVGAVGSALRARAGERVILHSDVAQVLGKGPFSMVDLGVDAVTISGHKFGSVSGVGALIVHESVSLKPIILGGPQEEKLRGGTENVLGIVHMGLVAKEIASEVAVRAQAMQRVRDAFEKTVQAKLPGCECNGANLQRLPNTSSVFIPGVRADDLVVALDLKGILVSAGAACSSGKPQPSHVLTAMGQDEERVRQTVRFSFRADQSEELGKQVAEAVIQAVSRMRALRE
jgi:cysteine desulfurase